MKFVHRGGKTVIRGTLEGDGINICIQDIRNILHDAVLQVENLLETGVHDPPDLEDKHGDNGGADAGQRNVDHLLEAAGAVHDGGLVKGLVNSHNRGHVDDRAPADLLPVMGDIQEGAEQLFISKEIDALPAQGGDDAVDHAAVGKEIGDQGGNDHPAEEVREGIDDLVGALELCSAHFVDQDGQDDGHRKLPEQAGKIDLEGVPDGPDGGGGGKNARKIGPADPLGSPDAKAGVEFLERKHKAAHRNVVENNKIGKNRYQQNIQIPCLPDAEKIFVQRLSHGGPHHSVITGKKRSGTGSDENYDQVFSNRADCQDGNETGLVIGAAAAGTRCGGRKKREKWEYVGMK